MKKFGFFLTLALTAATLTLPAQAQEICKIMAFEGGFSKDRVRLDTRAYSDPFRAGSYDILDCEDKAAEVQAIIEKHGNYDFVGTNPRNGKSAFTVVNSPTNAAIYLGYDTDAFDPIIKQVIARLDQQVDDGNADAAYALSVLLKSDIEYGNDLFPRLEKMPNRRASEYLRIAAELGHPRASHNIVSSPHTYGVSDADGFAIGEKAVAFHQNNPDAPGGTDIDNLYCSFSTLISSFHFAPYQVDDAQAVNLLSQVRQGVVGCSQARRLLAQHLFTGRGADVDHKAAADILVAGLRYGWVDVGVSTIRKPIYDTAPREVVREMQVQLKELGYYKSGIDGIAGPGFEKAVYGLAENCSVIGTKPKECLKAR